MTNSGHGYATQGYLQDASGSGIGNPSKRAESAGGIRAAKSRARKELVAVSMGRAFQELLDMMRFVHLKKTPSHMAAFAPSGKNGRIR